MEHLEALNFFPEFSENIEAYLRASKFNYSHYGEQWFINEDNDITIVKLAVETMTVESDIDSRCAKWTNMLRHFIEALLDDKACNKAKEKHISYDILDF
jgi:hypothetical protein